MTTKKSVWILASIVALLLSSFTPCKAAYPEKPIEFVIWASPGGGSDIFVRSMIRIFEPIIKQTFVPINKSGGGGAVGMAYTASKAPDGYTILAVTTNYVLTPTLGKSPKGPADFDPIARVAMETSCLAVKADAPYKDFKEFVEFAKKKGSATVGIFGVGTQDHVAGAELARRADIKVRFVPFEGGSDGNAALLGGHIDAMINNPTELTEQLASKQMRLLGVFSDQRWPFNPDVPSFKEQGYDAVVWQWRGIVAPKGTPQAVRDTLENMVKTALATEAFQTYLKDNQLLAAYLDDAGFDAFIKEQEAFYKIRLGELGMLKK